MLMFTRILTILIIKINFPLLSIKCIRYLLDNQTILFVGRNRFKFHKFLSKKYQIILEHHLKKVTFTVNNIYYELNDNYISSSSYINGRYSHIYGKFLNDFDWMEFNSFIKESESKELERANFQEFLNRNQELIKNEFERLSATSNFEFKRNRIGIDFSINVDHNNILEFISDLKIVSDNLSYSKITIECDSFIILSNLDGLSFDETQYKPKVIVNKIPNVVTLRFSLSDYKSLKSSQIGYNSNLNFDEIKFRLLSNKNQESVSIQNKKIYKCIMCQPFCLTTKQFIQMSETNKTFSFRSSF